MTSMVDTLTAEADGGEPRTVEQSLGRLDIQSGMLLLGDPQYLPGIEVANVTVGEIAIAAQLWQYPSGGQTLMALTLRLGDDSGIGPPRKIGQVAIDSGKLVVADKGDFDEHWTRVGNERLGVISTAPNDSVLRKLTKRFKLTAIRIA
ncbi:MAG TPA: hypothetical protein VND64_12275 [Pirellulales bacterium]|nr:hypothetical protein [Pirellulales bacterium]